MAIQKQDIFTQTDRKQQIYSDFLTDLTPHPVSGDIVRFVNETAVIRSIKNLILTNTGERLYQPDIGSDIRKLLFEPMNSVTAEAIGSLITSTITAHEPRARLVDLQVRPDVDNNAYNVSVVFMVINKQDPVSFNVTLTRVR